ncbi:MAG: hypothetical protein ABWK53_05270 [Anaerolineales bacterium]
MESLTILVVLLILLVFAGGILFSITANRRAKEAKMQMAQTLGMTPLEPDPHPAGANFGPLSDARQQPASLLAQRHPPQPARRGTVSL